MSNASDFIIENGVLKKYVGPGGDVVIPEGVKKIGNSAFRWSNSLNRAVLPEGVSVIFPEAFADCKSLESVVLPESLEDIDANGAFDVNTQDAIIFTVKQDSFAEQYCRDKGLNYTALDEENWNLVYGDASETD